ncbi:hypothetical protein B4135_4017 [Caldibacillus debilis]|uniref:Uncharacterized protein n=1 Tax=Caldibacillus debilis TaxID=301148 RepID=A0A150L8K0_9BACI|nr:hypothetical protein B4135_4017 [Caldibacillus debilis]
MLPEKWANRLYRFRRFRKFWQILRDTGIFFRFVKRDRGRPLRI